MDHYVLIDGNSLVNRAFYAGKNMLTTKDGTPTNAVFGFIKLLLKIISDVQPKYLTVAFDVHAPTFRHKMYEEYKGTRKPMPEELKIQIPIVKETLAKMGISMVELAGYEADDLIGTLAHRFPVHTIIYTGDRDSYQLVNETTDVHFTLHGVSDLLKLTSENFKDTIGITPKQIIDLKSLMGDSSDHIIGVPGIGEKTAFKMIQDYGSLENVYAHASDFSPSIQTKLKNGAESAKLSKVLATIDTNVPIDYTLEDAILTFPFSAELKTQFSKLEFTSLLDLDIYKEDEVHQTISYPPVRTLTSLAELETLYNDAESIPFYYDGNFHFYFKEEVFIPVQKTFFDEGFGITDVLNAINPILSGKKTVIFYDYKTQKHQLKNFGFKVTCPYQDASMLTYLVDSNGASATLEEVMKGKLVPAEYLATTIANIDREYKEKCDETTIKLYEEIELPLADVLYNMEEAGVRIDIEMLDFFAKQYAQEMKTIENKIYEIAGEKFNIKSPAQLGTILFDKLGLPAPKKNKKGGYSTNQEVLEKLEEYEIVRHIQSYRVIQKLYSTYIEGFRPLIDTDGKIHTTYNQLLTTTGRLSSSNPNLQNIPTRKDYGREIRKMFLPSEGHIFLDADYSQIELRLLAHFSECKELIDAYNSGKDIHTATASQIFSVPMDRVTADQRRQAKTVNFGIIYGISAFSLSQDLHITTKEASYYIEKYFTTYSTVKDFMNQSVAFAKETGYVTTLLGRKRYIPEIKATNFIQRSFGERAAMNMPLQGTSADIIKIAMLRVAKRLEEEGLKSKLILQVHDELVIDTLLSEKKQVAKILQYEMEHAVELKVPLVAEVQEGVNWYEAK